MNFFLTKKNKLPRAPKIMLGLLFSGLFANNNCQAQSILDSLSLLNIKSSIINATTGIQVLSETATVGSQAWVYGNPISNWYGVTVNAQGRVEYLDLGNLHTLATIDTTQLNYLPSDIFNGTNFEQLIYLNLSNCGYNAPPLQPWYNNTTDSTRNAVLQEIIIDNNRFDDANAAGTNSFELISKVAAGFPSLQKISARNCVYNPSGSLTMSSVFYSTFSPMIYAEIAHLDGNGWASMMPPLNKAFPNLIEGTFSDNGLKGILPFETTPQPVIQHLDFSYNEFDGASYYTMLFNECSPNLHTLIANNSLSAAASDRSFECSALNTAGSTFRYIDLSDNGLTNSSPLNLDIFLTTVTSNPAILSFAKNNFSNLQISDPPTDFYKLRMLDLSMNNFDQPLPSTIFNKTEGLEELWLSDNHFTGNFTLNSGSNFFNLQSLKYFDISFNDISGILPLEWFFGWCTPNNPSPIILFDFDHNSLDNVQELSNPDAGFASLSYVSADNNRFDYGDLSNLVHSLKMTGQNGAQGWYYAPYNVWYDTTAFRYTPQDSLGIGGTRHKEMYTTIIIDEQATPSSIGTTEYVWVREDPSGAREIVAYAEKVQGVMGIFYADSLGTVASISPSVAELQAYLAAGVGDLSITTASQTHSLSEDIALVISNADSIYGDWSDIWRYQTRLYNDSFPNLDLVSRPKRLIVSPCYDTSGQVIQCQQTFVQYNGNYSPQKSGFVLNERQRQALRDSLGVRVIKTCPCGDLEMWEISDTTYQAYLQSNGSGTRNVATANSGKPGLLSANADYTLEIDHDSIYNNNGSPTTNTNGSAVKIAIIDSGVDYNHRSITEHILPIQTHSNDTCDLHGFGYNFPSPSEYPFDEQGHGTNVAGVLVGAASSTSTMVLGTDNNQIAIMPFKYTDSKNGGTLFDATCAMYMAIENGVKVINASWGYKGDECPGLQDAILYAQMHDVAVVCAAGNDGANNTVGQWHWPSGYSTDSFGLKNIISVAALADGNNEVLASYSNFSNWAVHLATEGTVNTTGIDNSAAGNITVMEDAEGTSFAAPKVARAVGLLRYLYPNASVCDIKEALRLSVDTLQSADSDKLVWRGRLNFDKAVQVLDTTTIFAACPLVGIEPIPSTGASATALTVYPNPFNNTIYLQWENTSGNIPASIHIYSIDGRLRHHFTSNNNLESISTNDWQAGFYILQVKRDGKIYTEKIVKY